MMFTRATVIGALMGLATFASAAAVPEQAAAALEERVWKANIDVTVACREQYNDMYAAVVVNNGCGGWKCKTGDSSKDVNMDNYCTRRFVNAYAACGGGTVWDWQCHDRS
ncbi:hypothetical protein B0H67DRAFT_483675 [Lasiosphaeris hirsuta]|uniref:Uncharacterized protein n=1 Tax=Lasiosphaeris hirsuta TaxID=260670 RepID=A0AA40E1V6_9PEZI|nr:hypothetical protein B0H67DRAFT_483675 [Lasiosphaeris hirsuta]